MATRVAGQVLQTEREVEQVADIVLGVVARDEIARCQLGVLLRRLRLAQRIAQAHAQGHRDQLGDAIDEAIGMAQHAPAVAHHRLGGHGAVGDDLADPVAAVLARDVVDHLVAAVHAEVDVEVGHRHPFRIQETLEQQVVR